MIGDGCLTLKKNPSNYSTNVYFSNTEEDVINRLNENFKEIGIELVKNPSTQCQYILRGKGKALLIREIRKLGLNRKSDEKFIPKDYLTSSIEDRRQLLCGLMDTDGSVGNQKHKYSYSTIIKALKYELDPTKIERAFGILNYLRKQNVSGSDEIIFNCLIEVCLKLKMVDKAEKV